MSALIVMALESGKDATVKTCFHFFQVVFIILTLPLFYKFFFRQIGVVQKGAWPRLCV
jgi:uncharacterized membrane protein AbrB (regulator of aidB expression)